MKQTGREDERKARLAAALRQNLHRRKAEARATAGRQADEETGAAAPGPVAAD